MSAGMPSLEQMKADIAATQPQSAPQPPQPNAQTQPGGMPSLEQMQADIKAHTDDGGSFADKNLSPAPGLTGPVTLRGMAKGAVENLPVIGAIGGAALGALGTFGAGAVPLAMAGGAGGQALKEAIEQGIMGVKRTPIETAGNMATQGALAGMGEALAGPALKAAKAAAPAVGSTLTSVPAPVIKAYMDGGMPIQQLLAQAGGKIAVAAEAVQQKIMGTVEKAQSDMEMPALKVIGQRATQQSDAEVGATVKDLLTKDIQKRYGPFTEAYSKIDAVNQNVALPDEGRRNLTQGIKDWALENHPESSDTYKIIQKHAQNVDASNTGAQLQGAMSDLKGDLADAYKSGNSKRIDALTEMQSRVSDFQEKQITDLAKRISKGTASPDEMAGFEKMMNLQQDPTVAPSADNLAAYTKSVANDYLDHVDTVNKDYGGLKQYLSFVQQQTGAKKSMGAGTLIKNIQSIPEEKLAMKMFTPDKTTALAQLKQETPEIFNQLAGAHVRDMAANATIDGSFNTQKFISSVSEMPKEVRNLVFSPAEQNSFSKVANNPKLQSLLDTVKSAASTILKERGFEEHLLEAGTGKDTASTRDLGRLSNLTGTNLTREVQQLTAARDLGQASGQSMAKRVAAGGVGGAVSGMAGGEALGLGHMPVVGAAMGAVGGAATSPYAVKLGVDALNSGGAPMAASTVMQGAAQGANTLGQSIMHGSGAVNALRQTGPQQ